MPKKNKGSSRSGRGMWSGTISFGLVSVPVSLFPALRRRPVHLRMLAEDGVPLERQYVCSADGEVLDRDEIVRGYEMDDGEVVTLEEDELEAVEPEKSRDIKLKDFVDLDEIPLFHFDRPYFLAPAGGSVNAYRLLAHVMEERRRAGIATFVMHDKEHLVAIVARGGLLMAETLRFADEIRSPEEIGLPEPASADPELVETLGRKISRLKRKSLAEEDLKDRYAERFQELLRRKKKSRRAVVRTEAEEEEPSNVIDLVAVFKERMRAAQAEGEAEAEAAQG